MEEKRVNRSTQVASFPPPTSLNFLHLLKVSRVLPFATIMGKKRERRLFTPPSVPLFCLEEVGEAPRRRRNPPSPPLTLPACLLFDYSSTSSVKMQGRGFFFVWSELVCFTRATATREKVHMHRCLPDSSCVFLFGCKGSGVDHVLQKKKKKHEEK